MVPKLLIASVVLVIIPCTYSYTNSTAENPHTRRQLNIPGQEYTVRTNQGRQIIKIPANARIKVVQPNPQRPNRSAAPKKYQNRPPQREDDYDEEIPQKLRKNKKKNYYIREVSPDEFYNDDEEFEGYKKSKRPYAYQNNNQLFKKKRKDTPRRPNFEEDSGYDIVRPGPKKFRESPQPLYEDNGSYEDYSASAITMKQVPAPNLANEDHKNKRVVKKQRPEFDDRYHESYPAQEKKVARHMQSVFSQQYTTHNPQVTQTFGLPDPVSYNRIEDLESDRFGNDYLDQQTMSSDVRPVDLPGAGSGIHIVKPPQFRGGSNEVPTLAPAANQRATIRDILLQDCPDAEILGFCASPPRYPTQQISSIVEKCSDLIDAMYSPQPPEPEDDLSSFSSRSDDDTDIEFVSNFNESAIVVSDQPIAQPWSSSWDRSLQDGSNTICSSLLTTTEPGYARDVVSGRWFVILQLLDSVMQRIVTDTCEKPGKACTGLTGLKCSRSGGFNHFKSTRCIQRYIHQRLISWDPEVPQMCPKVRVFRFPSACLCHLSID